MCAGLDQIICGKMLLDGKDEKMMGEETVWRVGTFGAEIFRCPKPHIHGK